MTESTFEPIAVVGQSCILPGASSPGELWSAVAAGRDLVSSVPEGRWGLAKDLATTPSPADAADRTWSDRGGYVRGFEEVFDPEGFRLPADQVRALDPLFQWVLHTGREALKSAGLDGDEKQIGVVLGNLSFPAVLTNRYAEACWLRHQSEKLLFAPSPPDARNRFTSGLPAHLLAQALGLAGRAFALDDACASSLYAVKLACDRLHDRQADAMLAGAVSCVDDLFLHVGFCALEALSRSGRSRPFHRGADGLLPAEGAAFVVLKRLEDAVRDGDDVLGVIRGVGLSNDGRGRGFLAPSEEGQGRALRQAYEQSGLRPADVSLVECHATGTPVGDATELRSLGDLYRDLSDVPIGSLKSNLGHLITAAGLAGLLKVLGALKAKRRPPTLHVDDPNPVLEGSPFRLLYEAEPWPSEGPRRAAVSAFGFGGNNAHLLVEEWQGNVPGVYTPGYPMPPSGLRIAVVALSVIAAGGEDVEDFASALFSGESRLRTRPDGSRAGLARPIELPLAGLRFPPRDLEQTLPQQLLLLKAARQAVDTLDSLPRERTGVLVGMQCDAEIARYGLRWRLAGWARDEDDDWIRQARDAVVPGLEAAGVVGTMPNMPANRLNSQLDLGGPSATFSSEELSGVVALELAVRALGAGEMDAALVGAVDLSCEPVHEAAAQELLPEDRQVPGDAAVVLVLKRLADARSDGDRVLAVLGDSADGASVSVCDLTPRFGHAHAASGLLHVAAAVLACHQRTRPQADGPAVPWLDGPRRAEVEVEALGGQRAHVQVMEADGAGSLTEGHPRVHGISGEDRRQIVERLRGGSADGGPSGPARLAIVARDGEELAARRAEALKLLEAGRLTPGEPPVRGIHFREKTVGGELAYVFTGAAAAYAGMGRELLLAFPELTGRLGRRMSDLEAVAGWIYGHGDTDLTVLHQLWGSSFLCQAHAELSDLLGLSPDATLGYSSGESNALMALGAWSDNDALYRDTVACGLFSERLAGDFTAVRQAWGHSEWANWILSAPVDDVRAALADEERAYLTIVSSPEDVVIGGEAAACRRVIERLEAPAHPLGYAMAVHCPMVETVAEEWLELHRRPTAAVAVVAGRASGATGVRVYTHADGGRWYEPTSESAARAILGQAVTTIDFPALVKKAWDDGVRTFVEHGPRGLCSRWIGKTLRHHGIAADEYLAVAYDRGGSSSIGQTAEAVAELWTAGVDVRTEAWNERPRLIRPAPAGQPTLTFAAHWPEIRMPPLGRASKMSTVEGEAQWMAPAPELPSVLEDLIPEGPKALRPPSRSAGGRQEASFAAQTVGGGEGWGEGATPSGPPTLPLPSPRLPLTPALSPGEPPRQNWSSEPGEREPEGTPSPPDPAWSPVLANVTDLHSQLVATRQEYLDSQTELLQRFLALQQNALSSIVSAFQGAETHAAPPPPATTVRPEVPSPPPPVPVPEPERTEPAPPSRPAVPSGEPRGEISYTRQQLETLASGRISSVFGPFFEPQDGYERQVRMPEPPFLLADRVTGIDAEPGSMELGTIWTETDVREDSWYLHHGRIPGGILIEAGQADLLLISWLGVDFQNRGERVYRLLGCELTYRGPLPKPGDTLCYDIHVDGHAQQGDVRLFFFHYDCRIDGEVRLEVRHGQAGFFTDEELADSDGVLWDPTAESPRGERLDAPQARCPHRGFTHEQLVDYSEGRVFESMGPGFELAAAHTLTPRIQSGRMLLLDRVTDFDLEGGPWKRGYLRAVTPIRPDDWIFEGHFKNDPCMPGTLMLEGCYQTMALYLTAMGFTLERDGWRFEPVPDEGYTMRCRGQVVPSSRELHYELFVHEVIAGPLPTLYADLLCTVDGLKAFHAERVGLRLVPDWPLSVRPLPVDAPAAKDDTRVATVDGFAFDYASLLACAWGRPSTAFGEMYRGFDGPRAVARLPGPPYHFMSRIATIDGEMGSFEPGAVIEAEYDVPEDAWYFHENGARTMPYAVLLEVGLQPCGWLASFVGSALTTDEDLRFRNLDGTGTLHAEILPSSGRVKNRVELLATSQSAGIIIVRFKVEMRIGEQLVYDMDTAFGFFPKAAMANQVGLVASDEERAALGEASDFHVDLRTRPERYCEREPRLAGPRLLMLDRISGYWAAGGKAGLGRLRAEKDVDPNEWFFKAHFFQDPVQPGSLGIEAMVQLLQFYMIHTGLGEGVEHPRFEPVASGLPMTWKYRGQVLPTSGKVTIELEVTEVGRDERGPFAVAESCYWIDGKRIYSATSLGMRIVAGRQDEKPAGEEVLDPERDRWIADHCPTWTLPALPMMSMVDRLAAAALARRGDLKVAGLENVELRRWIAFPGGGVRLRTEVLGEERRDAGQVAFEVGLQVWREARRAELSRFETAAVGTVVLAPSYGEAPQAPEPLAEAEDVPDPYASGALFHGPAFQLLRRLRRGAAGSSSVLAAKSDAVPFGVLNQALLDAATHGIPHDEMHLWSPEATPDVAGYPRRLEARFHAPPPAAGEVRCEARFEGGMVTRLRLIADERVWADLRLQEVLLPKGRLGTASPSERRAFLGGRRPSPGLALSRLEPGGARLSEAEVAASDWLAGTMARAYAADADANREALTREMVAKDHVARLAGVHPATVAVRFDATEAEAASGVVERMPLHRFPVAVRRDGEDWVASDRGVPWLDTSPVRDYWRRYFDIGRWPVEDVYYGLTERFVRHVIIDDPEAFRAIHGRPVLFLANHQVGVESLLFSTVAAGLVGLPTVTLAKDAHRATWLGRLIAHCFSYPGIVDPELITMFERDAAALLPGIIERLGQRMANGERAVMIHADGTRSLACREPVKALSSTFIDLVLKIGAPIVPARFAGGLPVEPLTQRLEFPLGFGRQDYWFGRPILPEELAGLRYGDRRDAVLEAVNSLGPSNEEEPLPADDEFRAEVEDWSARTGASPEHAVIYKTLEKLDEPGPEVRRLVAGVESGKLTVADDGAGRWLAELARRLYGERGPRVEVSASQSRGRSASASRASGEPGSGS